MHKGITYLSKHILLLLIRGQASAELAVNKHTRIVVYFKYITNLEQFYNLYP